MKVYFDGIIYSWQKGGGVHIYIEELIQKCSENIDVDPILLRHLPSYNIKQRARVRTKNILGIRYVPNFLFTLFRKILSPINKMLINKYFKNIHSGIFHSTYYTTYTNVRIPQILTLHDMTQEKFPTFFNSRGAKRFIENKKKCILNADVIICTSNATKSSLAKIYPDAEKKVVIINQGLPREFMTDVQIDAHQDKIPKKPYFLFVGHRGLYKNFDFFVRGFAKWNTNKDYNLVLVGGNPLTSRDFLLFQKLGLENHISHLGFIDTEYLKSLYRHCVAFVYPSLDEGFGLPILEGISSRAKVIASDIAAFREFGKNMLIYFNPTDTTSLLAALDKGISQKITDQELDERAQFVRKYFTWDKCITKTIEIYKKTLHEKIY